MDFLSYPPMDILPFQQQNQQLFDCVDETFEMEQLLAAAFDSSSSSSSSELFQCSSNDDEICFDPLYSVSEFLLDANDDVFLPDDLFVDDKNYALVADDHKNDIIFVAHEDKHDHVFLADDDHTALFPQNHFMSPIDHCYQLGNTLNHPENIFNKRQKLSQNGAYKRPYYYNHDSTFFQGMLAPPPPQLIQNQPPPPSLPPFEFSIPPVFNIGISNNNKEEESRSLSSQSLSARQRRRKISEETKELGKLVPGGQKMNTAEMFEAASSYIKFLQAQFAVLQLTESSPSSSTPTEDEEGLKCLVVSPLVQEKLYSNKKCLIPKGLVESLENHKEIQSNSQISMDVRNLILTFC